MSDKNLYTEDSIKSLDARSHIQLRVGMYAGDTSNPNQLLMEAFSNALDEHNIGHGNLIEVTIENNGDCVVTDHGQGFLINEVRDDGKTVLEACFSVINTSGKYTDDGVYEGTSLGTNGVGLKLVTFTSTFLEVCSHRDGKYELLRFEDGLLVSRDIGKWPNEKDKSGTTVKYHPNPKFFDTDKTDVKYFEKFFHDICCLCPNLTIQFNDESIHHDSIEDIIGRKIGKNIDIVNNHFVIDTDDFKLAMTFTSGSNSTIIPYVNYGYTNSGPHVTGIKSTITRVFNNWAKQNSILSDKDKNLDGSSIQEGILLICNILSKGVKYDAQIKSRVTGLESDFLTTLGEQLEIWLDNNPEDGAAILEKAIVARKAAEAAKKARAAVKNKAGKTTNKVKIMNPDKLKDAEYLGEDSILTLVEGK